MSPVDHRAMVNRAVSQVLIELATAGMEAGAAASLVTREAALHVKAYRGPEKAATTVRALADEMERQG